MFLYDCRNDALYIQPNKTEINDWTFVKPKFFSSGAKTIKNPAINKVSSLNFVNKKRKVPRPIPMDDMMKTVSDDKKYLNGHILSEITTENSNKLYMFNSKMKISHLIGLVIYIKCYQSRSLSKISEI